MAPISTVDHRSPISSSPSPFFCKGQLFVGPNVDGTTFCGLMGQLRVCKSGPSFSHASCKGKGQKWRRSWMRFPLHFCFHLLLLFLFLNLLLLLFLLPHHQFWLPRNSVDVITQLPSPSSGTFICFTATRQNKRETIILILHSVIDKFAF